MGENIVIFAPNKIKYTETDKTVGGWHG